MSYNGCSKSGEQVKMLIDKLLTRKGWRLVSHCLLAACGIAFLYIIVNGMMTDIDRTASHRDSPVSVAGGAWRHAGQG